MIRFAILFLSTFIFTLNQEIKSQTILPELSKMYFNADVRKLDSTLISYYKKDRSLIYYSFDSALIPLRNAFSVNDENLYKFTFTNHPSIKLDSVSGYIAIYTKKNNRTEKVISLTLVFNKLNERKADSIFSYLSVIFAGSYSQALTEIRAGANRTDIKFFNFSSLKKEAFLIKKLVSLKKEFEVSFEIINDF